MCQLLSHIPYSSCLLIVDYNQVFFFFCPIFLCKEFDDFFSKFSKIIEIFTWKKNLFRIFSIFFFLKVTKVVEENITNYNH